MTIPPPNYTQIPNVLFELMPEMAEAELRVTLTICRQTFGWHKVADQLSITQLQDKTGLSRQGVINGVQAGMERGTIVRQADGNSYLYSLSISEVVNQVDSQRSRPEVVNEVDQPLVNEVDLQKKGLKEKEKNLCGGSAAQRPNAFAVYEQEIGALTKNIADLLMDDLNTYPEEWVEDALREASKQNKRSLAYAEGILKRWKADGRGAGKPQPAIPTINAFAPGGKGTTNGSTSRRSEPSSEERAEWEAFFAAQAAKKQQPVAASVH